MYINQNGSCCSASVKHTQGQYNLKQKSLNFEMFCTPFRSVFDGRHVWISNCENGEKCWKIDIKQINEELAEKNVSSQTAEPISDENLNENTFYRTCGVYANNHVWFLPYKEDCLTRIDPLTSTMTGFSTKNGDRGNQNLPSGDPLVICGTYDGRYIWMVSNNATEKKLIRLDPIDACMVGFDLPEWVGVSERSTIVFDGTDLWLPPADSTMIMTRIILPSLTFERHDIPITSAIGSYPFGAAVYDEKRHHIWLVPFECRSVIGFDTSTQTYKEFPEATIDGWPFFISAYCTSSGLNMYYIADVVESLEISPCPTTITFNLETQEWPYSIPYFRSSKFNEFYGDVAYLGYFKYDIWQQSPKSQPFMGMSFTYPAGFEVTETFTLEDGTPIHHELFEKITLDGGYVGNPPTILGYCCIGYILDDGEFNPNLPLVIDPVEQNHSVQYIYAEAVDEGIVITEQYLCDGMPIQEETYVHPEEGEDYIQVAPKISGYKRVGHKIDNSEAVTTRTAAIYNIRESHVVTFLYEPCDGEKCQDILVTEHYYDVENQTSILPDTYEYMAAGDDYIRVAPKIEGYKRVGHKIDNGQAVTTRTAVITDIQEDHDVTFLYEPCDGEKCQDILITEHYYDRENGVYIRPETYEYLAVDDDYRKTAPAISGYKRVGHRIDDGPENASLTAEILAVQEDHDVYFLYEPGDEGGGETVIITESYYDVVNEVFIRPDTTTTVALGGNYAKAAPGIGGYKRVGHNIDGGPDQASLLAVIQNVTGPHHITFLYEPLEDGGKEPNLVVIESYYDVQNNVYIRPNTFTVVPYGGNYRKTAPGISGFRRVGHRIDNGPDQASLTAIINGVVIDHQVTFLYEPVEPVGSEYRIILESYYDRENDVYIRPDTYTVVRYGSGYSKTAPVISGYKRVGHNIDDGPDQPSLTAVINPVIQNHHVTFLYEPGEEGGVNPPPGDDEVQIVERYYDVENDEFIRPNTYTNVQVGSDYAKTAPAIPGYFRLGHQIDDGASSGSLTARIWDVQEPHVVTFLYRPDDGGTEPPEDGILIIERYLDISRQVYLRPDTYTKVARGATYRKTALAISGYFRMGHRIDNGPDQSSIIAVIQDVQESHVVTFLYEPAVDCDDFVIRERYYDVKNEEYIRPDTETLVEPGGDYAKEAPAIEGYKRVGYFIDNGERSENLTAVILNVMADHVVTFLYEPAEEEGGGKETGDCCCCCCKDSCMPVMTITIPIRKCNNKLIREVTEGMQRGDRCCCCCCCNGTTPTTPDPKPELPNEDDEDDCE